MSSSTSSSGCAVLNGWRLEDVPPDELAALLKIERTQATVVRASLVKQQTDPAWIAEMVDAVPAATLALLSLVIDAGGLMMQDALLRAAHESFGMSADDCRVAATPAISRLLMVPLSTRNHEIALGAVLPAALLIAPLVADLELRELPADAFVVTESPARNARTFLATCVATRHFDIKLTNGGRPHRGAIKRLAKQVGLDEDSLDVMLGSGLKMGLLTVEGELVRPDLAALAEAAVGRYPGHRAFAEIQGRLSRGPVASDALYRALLRRGALLHPSFPGRDAMAWLPGFAVGTVDGIPALAVRALEGTASGHVTPSFEVFLPPESRLVDVVHVGACCEWERLDRAFVARITKASVARAVAGGASAGQLLEQLAAAVRHPIPQNVEAAIRDWASSVIAATIATGHVIVVAPSEHVRVARALTGLAARELAPGVFVVDDVEEIREITAALIRAGVHHREVSPVRAPPERMPSPEPGVLAPGAARVRARVAAWREGVPFEGVRDDFLDKHRATKAAQAAKPEKPAAPAATTLATPLALLERWASDRELRFDSEGLDDKGIAATLEMLSDGDVAGILDECRDLDDLLAKLAKLLVTRGWSKPPPARSGRAAVPPPARARRGPPPLLWQHEDLRERLQQAAKRSELLAVQLAGGVRYLEITQMIRRGTTWMVLGEDIASDDAVALRLDDIQAIAALPDDFDGDDGDFLDGDDGDFLDVDDGPGDGDPLPRKRWRPGPGQPSPAGHVPCPCGSGGRYRTCCRDIPSA